MAASPATMAVNVTGVLRASGRQVRKRSSTTYFDATDSSSAAASTPSW